MLVVVLRRRSRMAADAFEPDDEIADERRRRDAAPPRRAPAPRAGLNDGRHAILSPQRARGCAAEGATTTPARSTDKAYEEARGAVEREIGELLMAGDERGNGRPSRGLVGVSRPALVVALAVAGYWQTGRLRLASRRRGTAWLPPTSERRERARPALNRSMGWSTGSPSA